MDGRRSLAVASAIASLGVMALGAYAVVAADAIRPGMKPSASSLKSGHEATGSVDTWTSGAQPVWAASGGRISSVSVVPDKGQVIEEETPKAGFEEDRDSGVVENGRVTLGLQDQTMQLASTTQTMPVFLDKVVDLEDRADASKARRVGVRLSWDITRGRCTERSGSYHARCCAAIESATTEKGRTQVAFRRGIGDERAPARMALVLGVAF